MGAKILIVDDDPDMVNVLANRLESVGYEVYRTYDGEAGLDLMRENLPDLVILDILMPGKDGFEICKLAKKDSKIKHIPVLFLTGANENYDMKKVRALGGYGFIRKPFEGESLLNDIELILDKTKNRS